MRDLSKELEKVLKKILSMNVVDRRNDSWTETTEWMMIREWWKTIENYESRSRAALIPNKLDKSKE